MNNGNPCSTGGLHFYNNENGITGYNDPVIEYKDENGALIFITLPDGSVKKPNELTATEFIMNFDPI